MLQILGFWSEVSFTIISGIFSSVARVYDILINLTENMKGLTPDHFDNMRTTIYVLAGVFMLFRVVISMIQMLINPDLVTHSDKNAGAGKLVANVITSIIMLMVFVPNGLIFGSSGLLTRLEDALLNRDDGLVTRLSNMGDVKKSASGKVSNKKTYKTVLAEEVYAETEKLTCYYIDKSVQKVIMRNTGAAGQKSGTYSIDVPAMYKIEFYKDSTSGENKINNSNYSYTDRGGQRIGGKEENGRYSKLDSKISAGNVFDENGKFKCPKSFKKGKTYLIANKDFPNGSSVEAPGSCNNNKDGGDDYNYCDNVGIMGGWEKLADVEKSLNAMRLTTQGGDSIDSNVPFVSKNTTKGTLHNTDDVKRNVDHLRGVSPVAIAFAQTTASSLQDCTDEKKEECEKAQSEMFVSSKGDDNVIKLMDSKDLKVDFIFSVIAGIGIMVYLLFLCVEVIIRKFKLYLLEVMAPIAIISHVDPKDQIFGKWYKMLLSVYVDLFIKLIAIGFAISMIEGLKENMAAATGPLVKFFYIVAILVFAKIVPTMISKIFGLDSMGGSFKDIAGMAKKAVGVGAGAVVVGAAGAMTGKGLGRLSGFAKGALMGAGAGAKGNIKGGVNAISNKNARINDAKANGLNFWQRTGAEMAASVGYNPKTRMDNKIKSKVDAQKLLDDFRKRKDNVEEMAEKFSPIYDLKQQMLQGKVSKDQFKAVRDSYIAAVERGDRNFSGSYTDKSGKSHNIFQAIGDSDRDKVTTAIELAKIHYDSNSALQKEITKANGGKHIEINSYSDYKKAEGIATSKSNEYQKEITAVQSSDEYGRATAVNDYMQSK